MPDDIHRQVARPTAKHELGHYVVGEALGFRMCGVTIRQAEALRGYEGGSEFEPATLLGSMDELKVYCKNRVAMLNAGVLAEQLHAGKVDRDAADKALDRTGKDDASKMRELLHLFRSTLSAPSANRDELKSQLERLEKEACDLATRLVEENASVISKMAEVLLDRLMTSMAENPDERVSVTMDRNDIEQYPIFSTISRI